MKVDNLPFFFSQEASSSLGAVAHILFIIINMYVFLYSTNKMNFSQRDIIFLTYFLPRSNLQYNNIFGGTIMDTDELVYVIL